MSGFAFLKNLNGLAPRSLLRVVDFTEIQNLPLNMPISLDTPIFHDAPFAMNLAVLATND
ncbi:MAG: hypothetical protein HQL89_12285 [Magnetococcales bacterium]|nr:hypothetical protein [Magnetococcales bacterium]